MKTHTHEAGRKTTRTKSAKQGDIMKRHAMGIVIVLAVLIAGGATSTAEGDADFVFYSTISTGGDSHTPNTLVTVNRATCFEQPVGEIGAIPRQRALATDPTTDMLMGVRFDAEAQESTVTLIDPDSGEWEEVAVYPGILRSIAIAPDGTPYAILGDRTLVVLDIDTMSLDFVAEVAGAEMDYVQSLDFSADGVLHGVLYLREPEMIQRLVTIDLDTAEVITSVELWPDFNIGDIACAPDGYIYATNYSWAIMRILPNGMITTVGFGNLGALSGMTILGRSATSATNPFEGDWVNVDPDTRGCTRFSIYWEDPSHLAFQGYGACAGSECVWDLAYLRLYTDSVSSTEVKYAQYFQDNGWSEQIGTLEFDGTRLKYTEYTYFSDNSGRSHFRSVEYFVRAGS